MVEWAIKMSKFKTYSELLTFDDYKSRLEYLKLNGSVGAITFGGMRWLNQNFYRSRAWKTFRNDIILRDNGCDLALPGYDLYKKDMYIHHIVPITEEMIRDNSSLLLDPENVVLVGYDTHTAIHYGDFDVRSKEMADRKPNDTCLWKGGL